MTDSVTARLGDLDFDPVAFDGQDKRLGQLDDLMASIPAEGLLQSLLVRPWDPKRPVNGAKAKKGGGPIPMPLYGVVAGRRRLATLRRCRDEGLVIKGVVVTDDFSVPLVARPMTDAEVLELSVVENVQRLAMSPGQEALAFARMAEASSAADIAVHFGVTEKRVRQRLRIAAVHPEVLAALDAGEISIAAAEAYTIEADPQKQVKWFRKANNWARNEPHQIRDAFTEKLVTATSPVAKLIGKKAYLAAGGQVLADEFSETTYWISPDLIKTLLAAHWKEAVTSWQAEGWLFVETVDEFTKGEPYRIHSAETLRAPKGGFTEAQRAVSGVVYAPDGSSEPRRGVLRRGTRVNNDGSKIKAARSDAPEAALTNPGPSTASLCNEAMTKALRDKVAVSPDLGLAIVVATMHVRRCYYQYPPVHLTTDGIGLPDRIEDDARHPWGTTFPTALAWAVAQPRETLVAALAELVAPLVDVRGVHGMPGAAGRALIDIVDPDAGAFDDVSAFDPLVYFTGLTKPLIAAAAREFAPGSSFKEGKKGELVTAATAMLRGTGWLPPQLRTASYTGPGGPPAPVVDRQRHPQGGDVAEAEDDGFEEEDEDQLEAAE